MQGVEPQPLRQASCPAAPRLTLLALSHGSGSLLWCCLSLNTLMLFFILECPYGSHVPRELHSISQEPLRCPFSWENFLSWRENDSPLYIPSDVLASAASGPSAPVGAVRVAGPAVC